jgi:hypothetical protein
LHAYWLSPKYAPGQGFIEATSVKRADDLVEVSASEILAMEIRAVRRGRPPFVEAGQEIRCGQGPTLMTGL